LELQLCEGGFNVFIYCVGFLVDVEKHFCQQSGSEKLDADDGKKDTEKEQRSAVLDGAGGDTKIGDVKADSKPDG